MMARTIDRGGPDSPFVLSLSKDERGDGRVS